MPGMWELPQSSEPPRRLPRPRSGARFAIHHRYRLHSARASECGVNQCRSCRRSKWIAIDRIAQIPITGLTRKILKASGII